MRLIAGRAKGRTLTTPPGTTTRPPTGRMREALFSSLGEAVVDARVLDLYAGSGAFGLEALSRGAGSCEFVERSRAALTALERNVEAVGLGGVIRREDVVRYLERSSAIFDLAFVDPPFSLGSDELTGVMEALAPRIAAGGIVVLHRRAGDAGPSVPESLTLTDRRRYGDSELWRFDEEGR